MQLPVQSRRTRRLRLGHGGVALCIAGLWQPACADPARSTPAQVVVLGSRVPATVGQEAESLTVMTREQIERMGAATGPDLLRLVPGIQVDQLGGPGGLSLVYIRGSDPNHVLVLVDGVRVNDPTNSRGGGVDFSDLDPGQVERVEVLRGAASAVYGADAMAGVVNIVTRKAEPGASASVGAGGLGYRALSARATWPTAAGGRLTASAATLRDGLESRGGRLKLNQLALSARAPLSAASQVEVDLRHVERTSSAFPDDSGGIEQAQIRVLEQRESRTTTLRLRGAAASEVWTLALEGTALERQERIDSPGVAPGVRSGFGLPSSESSTRFRRNGLLLSAVRHLDGGSEWALGAEYQNEHGTSGTVYQLFGSPIAADFDLQRQTRSAFAELKWLATRELIVRAGLRHDAVQGSGSHTSPSIGARYSLPQFDGHFKASYAEGFKPPSFFALGLPPLLGGNPGLKAESSKGGSFGYEQRWGGAAEASLTFFQRRYSDLVTFESSRNQLTNADRVQVKGTELALRVQASEALSLQAHFTRLISQVLPGDEPLRQRPGRRAGAQLHLKLAAAASLVWRLEVADEIFDSSIPTGNVYLRSYLRNDVAFAYAISPRFNVTAAIDNLTDRNNQWYVGAPTVGRRVRMGAALSL